jgi:hypothetical protein
VNRSAWCANPNGKGGYRGHNADYDGQG